MCSNVIAQPEAEDLQDLLLDCLHLDAGRPETSVLAALGQNDWRRLTELGDRAGVRYQLYERLLQPRLRPLVPADSLAQLQAGAQGQSARLLRLRTTLIEILDACRADSLPVLVLKGMHLAHDVYASPVARDMTDVDVLFRRTDMPRATGMFRSLGYTLPHDTSNLIQLAPLHKEYTLTHPQHGVAIDVHWMLTRPQWDASIDEDELWDRAIVFGIQRRQALGLAPEDLIAYLCFHACYAHHFAFVGLRPFLDIAYICARNPDLDWARFSRRVQRWGWTRSATLTLSIAARYLGAQIPRRLTTAPSHTPADFDQLQRDALAFALAGAGTNDDSEVNLLRIATAPSGRARLCLVLDRLFPPRGQLIQEFGLSAGQEIPVALLHLHRIARLVPRHAPKLWRHYRQDGAQRAALAGRRRLVAWLNTPDPQRNGSE